MIVARICARAVTFNVGDRAIVVRDMLVTRPATTGVERQVEQP